MTVHWRNVIVDINRMGLSGAQIAERLNVAPTTINGLKNEQWAEPKYSLGAGLLELRERLQRAGLSSKGQTSLL
jgi:transcriptional regulator with XRE-family HTH domain